MYFRLTENRRERWTVKVPASRLIACCEERAAHHAERCTFWDSDRKGAEDKLRSEGIQLKHFSITGGQRMEAHLDASLAKRVTECEERLKGNKDAVARFHAFQSFFALAGAESFDLTADDVLYFNLEGADTGSDE